MAKYWLLLLFTLVGCNVANEPAALSSSSGATDSDTKISFASNSVTVSEGSASIALPFTFTSAISSATSVMFSFSGTAVGGASCTGVEDYVIPTLPNVVNAGLASSVLDITLCNDVIYEGSETLIVTIGSTSPGYGIGTRAAMTVLLQDSLAPPTITFSAAATAAVAEGSSGILSIPVSIEMSHASTTTITVDITSAGTATSLLDVLSGISTNEIDYYLSASQITFAPGVTSASVLVTFVGDDFIEPNESITLALEAPVNATLGVQSLHEMVIQQDETQTALEAALTVVPAAVNEIDGTMNIVVNLSGSMDVPVTLYYTLDYVTTIPYRRAAHGEDFVLAGFNGSIGQIVINPTTPYPATVNIPVTLLDDSIFEDTEQFVVRLLGGPSIDVAAGFEAVSAEINPSDSQPFITFMTSGQLITESNTAGNVVIQLLDPNNTSFELASGEDITVTLTTTDVTTIPTDWNLSATSIVIPAGTTRLSVPVTAVQDGVAESIEAFDIEMTGPAGYSIFPTDTHRVEISD